ncbi:uncharacterized protein O3C94_019196 [Discoglossus pictus]
MDMKDEPQKTASSPSNASSEVSLPSPPSFPTKHGVCVFSKSSQSNYQWLMSQLQSSSYGDLVKDVRAVYISNNSSQFELDLSDCTFAILYHTRKHGRINITDVMDSLYDRELEEMYRKLGRENLIVVIDGLEDSSEEEKNRILQSQPTIRNWATETFLFTEDENQRSSSSENLLGDGRLIEKLRRMKEIIKMRQR